MLGSNVPLTGGLHKGFFYANDWKCECIQIYTANSRRWDVDILDQQKVELFLESWHNSCVCKVVAHVPFLVNLASKNFVIREKAKKRLLLEIENANKLGIRDLIIHPGSHCGQGFEVAAEYINTAMSDFIGILEDRDIHISFETMSGCGSEVGSTFKQLAILLDKINSPNFGICFDSCHVFASGYDLRTNEAYHSTLKQLDAILGLERIKVFHLNDSKHGLGSQKDRHEHIGEGKIGKQFFVNIVQDSRFRNIPKILETPDLLLNGKSQMETLLKMRS